MRHEWVWKGPYIKVPWTIMDEPWAHDPGSLARYVRALVAEDKERRRRTRRRAYVRPSDWAATLEAFDHRCAYCGRNDLPLQKEHRVPIARGGRDDITNLVPACGPCNRRKFTADPADWPLLIEPTA